MQSVLTIAGSDSSGGAGIQADIKTLTMHNVFATSAITALTAQNTLGVSGILDVSPDFLAKQLDAVFADIYPDSVKIGMVSNPKLIEIIAEKLKQYNAKNIVLDPVIYAATGAKLIKDEAIGAMKEKLFPLATVITPNILEAEQLSGLKIIDKESMQKAAQALSINTSAVLCKGGHAIDKADDILYYKNQFYCYESKRINNPNTHGTGCTLSSAIAANLAQGSDLVKAVRAAKDYITLAIKSNLKLGRGCGPLNHMFALGDNNCFT